VLDEREEKLKKSGEQSRPCLLAKRNDGPFGLMVFESEDSSKNSKISLTTHSFLHNRNCNNNNNNKNNATEEEEQDW